MEYLSKAGRTTPLIALFSPGQSPPEVKIPIVQYYQTYNKV